MRTAYSILPDRFEDDRHGVMIRGLQRAGYRIEHGFGLPKGPEDILITWTVHRGHKEACRDKFEAQGGRVIVAEEAHLKRINDEKYFSLCLHDHNGAGVWNVGGAERWDSFNIELKPWRSSGEHILVREQRGIGSTKMASPPLWHDGVVAKLKRLTDRTIILRYHPKSRLYPDLAGKQPPELQALEHCWAVVTWASSIGTQALIQGIPVFCEASNFFLEGACNRRFENIESPRRPDRLPAFERFAWAQWSVREIQSGQAFDHLVGDGA